MTFPTSLSQWGVKTGTPCPVPLQCTYLSLIFTTPHSVSLPLGQVVGPADGSQGGRTGLYAYPARHSSPEPSS